MFFCCFVGVERGDGSGAELPPTSEGSAGQDSEGNGNQTELYTQQVNLHSPSQILLPVVTSPLQQWHHTLLCVFISHTCVLWWSTSMSGDFLDAMQHNLLSAKWVVWSRRNMSTFWQQCRGPLWSDTFVCTCCRKWGCLSWRHSLRLISEL